MNKSARPLFVLLALAATLLCQPLRSFADEIFSNFGVGDTYDSGSSWIISGSGSDTGFATRVGFAFVNSGPAVRLDSIEVAATGFSGSKAITVTINADNANNPGAELESFDTSAIGAVNSTGSIVKMNSITKPILQSGGVYYIVMRTNPPSSNGKVAWCQNNVNMHGSYRYSPDGGVTWFPSLVTYSAFRVKGTPLPVLSGVSVTPSSVPGGSTASGSVTLQSAVTEDTVVSLSSSNTAAHVPASVTVLANNTSASFDVTTDAVSSFKFGSIQASYNGVNKTASITVKPPVLSTLAITPTTVAGGVSATGTVTLVNAMSQDTVVDLSCFNPAAHVPATVTVPANAMSADFTITTDIVLSNKMGSISATLLGNTASINFTVKPVVFSGVSLNPTSVTGGAGVTGTVKFTGPVSTDKIVTLSSANAAAHLPASVIVLAGDSTATFPITTDAVTSNSVGAIGASSGGVNKSAMLTVKAPVVSSLSLSAVSVIGGTVVTGTVTLTGNTAADTVVTLGSANSAAHLPATVTVLSGTNQAVFQITTDAVTVNTAGAISATLGGVTKSATLTVKAPTYTAFTLMPAIVVGGNDVTATVTMSGPVAVDTVVNLLNLNAKATLPGPTVTILAGSASRTFTITTMPTAVIVSGAVKAQVGAVTKSVTLKVTP